MKEQEKAVVTVVGRDVVGIMAKVSSACAEANARIIEVTQSVMGGFFTMIMLIDITEMKGTIEELQNAIKTDLPNVEAHVMHENIFSAMYTI